MRSYSVLVYSLCCKFDSKKVHNKILAKLATDIYVYFRQKNVISEPDFIAYRPNKHNKKGNKFKAV